MLKRYIKILFLSAILFSQSIPVKAQSLASQPEDKNISGKTGNRSQTSIAEAIEQNDEASLDFDKMTPEEEREVNERLQKKYQPRFVNGVLQLNPLSIPNPTDGSKRGTAAFVALPGKDGKNSKENKAAIFIYYSNFSMSRSHVAGVGCRVRFNVLTTLDQRLTNLSVKLVWPDMTTNLSFNNVNPNIETYFDYALFGQGCYKMDKIPNIVVNRCRAKGMSQEQCASKIRWLSKSN